MRQVFPFRFRSLRRRFPHVALLACAVAIAPALQGCEAARGARDAVLDKAVSFVPREFDATLGAQAKASVLSRVKLVDDPATREGLAALARPLVEILGSDPAFAATKWNFHVAREALPNAFALPDGTIVVHTGLVAASRGSEELLGVLAHEVGHVVHRHGVRALLGQVGLGLLLSLLLGDASPLLAFGVEKAAQLSLLQFSRDQERQADASGASLLRRASLPVAGMARFFRRLQALEASREGDGALLSSFPFLRTHPVSEERARALEPLAGQGEGRVPADLQARFARWKRGLLDSLPPAEREAHDKVVAMTEKL